MDKFVKQALKTRAVFMLSFVVIAMMAVLVTHAGAMDLSAAQITTDKYLSLLVQRVRPVFLGL